MDIRLLVNYKEEPENLQMDRFAEEQIRDFKHVVYNLLVDTYNEAATPVISTCTVVEDGAIRNGFRLTYPDKASKRLSELYAQHVRKARLDNQDPTSVFTQDLYKFYFRACIELLSKYFQKKDKFTYLYDDVPLFVPGGSLIDAEKRIRNMVSRSRKRKRIDF